MLALCHALILRLGHTYRLEYKKLDDLFSTDYIFILKRDQRTVVHKLSSTHLNKDLKNEQIVNLVLTTIVLRIKNGQK